ncbi:sigma-70 family RNA polymerase sigma factor [Lysinibacillus sp. 54212]|uniref:sigma-70 family RNA polymerase sigma factor n=1 Tax=Lysinibacillus sp. 54212 TaxID=3119829 RepID=UPI002FCBD585
MSRISEETFRELMELYTEPLLKIAYLYVHDWQAAEDLVQDMFLTYYEKSSQFAARASIKTYLTRMLINKCKDYLKSWRYRTHLLTNKFFTKSSERNRIVERDERLQLAEAVLGLPLPYREVIIFYYFEELTVAETAVTLALSENTVKTRLRKARQLLKDRLIDERWEVLADE